YVRSACPEGNERDFALVVLRQRKIDKRLGLFSQAGVFAVLRDADDFDPFPIRKVEPFAKGFFSRPEAARKGLVDNGDRGALGVVLRGEVAALQQARLHRAEIIQADGGRQYYRRLCRGLRLIALNEDAFPPALAGGKWRVRGQRGCL